MANVGEVATAAIALLAGVDGATVGDACTNFTLSPCPALWASLESRTPTTVTFFNPLAWARRETVRIENVDYIVISHFFRKSVLMHRSTPLCST